MKNKFVILCLFTCLAACDMDFSETIGCNPQTKEIGLSGGSFKVDFSSYVDWTSSTPADWLHVNPETGWGDATLTITVDSATFSRKGVITFDNGYATTTLTINQFNPVPEDTTHID